MLLCLWFWIKSPLLGFVQTSKFNVGRQSWESHFGRSEKRMPRGPTWVWPWLLEPPLALWLYPHLEVTFPLPSLPPELQSPAPKLASQMAQHSARSNTSLLRPF